MNMLRDGAEWLAEQMIEHASSSVVYSRGAGSVTIDAVIGRSVFAVLDQTGNPISKETTDFIVKIADLVISDSQIIPDRNDKISETRNGVTIEYTVCAPSGEPVYRYTSSERDMVRIHAILTSKT